MHESDVISTVRQALGQVEARRANTLCIIQEKQVLRYYTWV